MINVHISQIHMQHQCSFQKMYRRQPEIETQVSNSHFQLDNYNPYNLSLHTASIFEYHYVFTLSKDINTKLRIKLIFAAFCSKIWNPMMQFDTTKVLPLRLLSTIQICYFPSMHRRKRQMSIATVLFQFQNKFSNSQANHFLNPYHRNTRVEAKSK